jgi:hypothetical protein
VEVVFETHDGAPIRGQVFDNLKETIEPVFLEHFAKGARAIQGNRALRIMTTKSYDRSNGVTDVPLWTIRM